MKYLAVLGRQPEISIAELEALSGVEWHQVPFSGRSSRPSSRGSSLSPRSDCGIPSKSISMPLYIDQLGGVVKLAIEMDQRPLEYLQGLPEGKITLGLSDYSKVASRKSASQEALKLKKILVRHGRSVRVVENKDAVLSTATSLHNGLGGKNERKVELIKLDDAWYRVIGVQDIDAYAKRDQARPARDAKVGMLPPKLAQILINLCGPLEPSATVLDPFCGTGVVLQEALLMGCRAYGTDINERMIEYSKRNLDWLMGDGNSHFEGVRSLARRGVAPAARGDGPAGRAPRNGLFRLSVGDATSFHWEQPIDAVACEGYLGKPFSQIPSDMALKEQKQECGAIVRGFLKNLAGQIKSGTPVVIAVPAWLRPDESYERLDIIDEIEDMGYNVDNKTREGLLYHRDGQVVARDILILRKK
ncbi:hypothetical protein IJI28_01695 [Candidatus Saccharibacteria bacterium]|nr:hypothetical protein [Candidatus Saccharibacteria bacterium]